ncbi:TusE/DsrC/DsvC family sulfur relay protein [Buchnera aphidicola (Ceratovacuna keduensis)]|uniref:TusE/DsrC/DsvC family sulfur relay protein n=1 Tax=Buchnera aphidicola TaxID=9 RepID=UPI0031B8779D
MNKKNKKILDKNGYLKKYKYWNKKIANQIAIKENITLTKTHWIIIKIIRKFYIKFERTPSMLIVYKILNKKIKKKIYLNKLFNNDYIKISSKISGLPKTNICI